MILAAAVQLSFGGRNAESKLSYLFEKDVREVNTVIVAHEYSHSKRQKSKTWILMFSNLWRGAAAFESGSAKDSKATEGTKEIRA